MEGHGYSILDFLVEDALYLVQLRNIWGAKTWRGNFHKLLRWLDKRRGLQWHESRLLCVCISDGVISK